MDASASVAVTRVIAYDDEEWELFNDDGFVYKRNKRRRISDSEYDAAAAAKASKPEVDPAVVERNRQERKRRILLKLKTKYQKEIEQWEILSNSSSVMQEKTDRFQTRQRQQPENTASIQESTPGEAREQSSEGASKRLSLLDEFLFMGEDEETMIQDVSNMCEIAEEMCREEEQKRAELYLDLPIWGSPTDLMLSLCTQQEQP